MNPDGITLASAFIFRISMQSPSSVMSALRAATKDAHDSLEHGLRIASPDATQTDYFNYLQDLWGWLAPFESTLWQSPWPLEIRANARADKLAWIAADLQALGLQPWDIAELPRCTNPPQLGTLAQRFGAAYVVEGAQLGTKLLAKRLGPQFAPWQPRWLAGYGADNGRYWRQFMQAAEHHLRAPALHQQAAQAAANTFETLDQWFAKCEQERNRRDDTAPDLLHAGATTLS